MARHDEDRNDVLGDTNPKDPADKRRRQDDTIDREQAEQSATGGSGSQHGSSEHAGSRDVTEGTTGGTGTEVGGTRNYRTGTGATGGDIGNRPE